MKIKIGMAILLIEQLSTFKISGRQKEAGEVLRELTAVLTELLPEIIACYEKPEFEAVKEDGEYWVDQLGRIVEAIDSRDDFKLIDVLHFETSENLRLFAEMVDSENE